MAQGKQFAMEKIVLYAEDDDNDVALVQFCMGRENLPINLNIVSDGKYAVEWLAGNGDYADRTKYPLPDILITDLKMGKMSGFEVVAWVRQRQDLQNLPVIVYSTSTLEKDFNRAMSSGATVYIHKTPRCQDLISYIRELVIPARSARPQTRTTSTSLEVSDVTTD